MKDDAIYQLEIDLLMERAHYDFTCYVERFKQERAINRESRRLLEKPLIDEGNALLATEAGQRLMAWMQREAMKSLWVI